MRDRVGQKGGGIPITVESSGSQTLVNSLWGQVTPGRAMMCHKPGESGRPDPQQLLCVHPFTLKEDDAPTRNRRKKYHQEVLELREARCCYALHFSSFKNLASGPRCSLCQDSEHTELWPLTYGWQSLRNYGELERFRKA